MDKDIFKDKAALLRSAIKGEEDGIAFYDLLAERAVNPEARRRLENLRDDEKRHKSLPRQISIANMSAVRSALFRRRGLVP